MELLLNELSFHNQFKSFEHFQETALIDLIYILNLQKLKFINVLKKSDFYLNKVYDDKTIQEILILKNKEGKSDEIRKLKSQLANIIYDPFWDSNKVCDSNSKYFYLKTQVTDTCLAEGYERNLNIISIAPSIFNTDNLVVNKEKVIKNLINYFSYKSIVIKLYREHKITFEFFCKNYFKGDKLNFSLTNSTESFQLIYKKSDEEEFFKSFKMFEDLNWDKILQQGGKGKNKAGLAYVKYHNQNYFADYQPKSIIYKFRASEKFRVFGYRINNIFYVLEFDLTHRLSD